MIISDIIGRMSKGRESWRPSIYNVRHIAQYPQSDLQNARHTLISCLQKPDSYVLEQIKIKMGIPNIYGKLCLPPPLQNNDALLPDAKPKKVQASLTQTSPFQNSIGAGLLRVHSPMQRTSTVTSETVKHETSAETVGKRKRQSTDANDGSESVTKRALCSKSSRITRLYKCDLCSYKDQDLRMMQSHLDDGEHCSASLYTASGNRLLSIEQLHVIKKSKGPVRCAVFVCTICNAAFQQMFLCAMHNKYWHGNANGHYSAYLVKEKRTISLTLKPECGFCHVNFSEDGLLNDHWISVPEHCPFEQLTDPLERNLFTCCCCSENFLSNFVACKSHVLQCYRHFSAGSSTVGVDVKHIVQSAAVCEIPSFNRSFDSTNGLDIEYDALSKLWHICTKDVERTRQQRRAIISRLNMLTLLYKENRK